MTEMGKVRQVMENLVIVAPDRGAACFGCMNAECKSAGFITAENPAGLPLEAGQTVELSARGASLLGQALTALLIPFLAFLLGFNLTGLIFPFPTAPDGASAGIGLLFLFAAAFAVYLVRKEHPATRGYKVTRILVDQVAGERPVSK